MAVHRGRHLRGRASADAVQPRGGPRVAGADDGQRAGVHLGGEIRLRREPRPDEPYVGVDRRVDARVALLAVVDGRADLVGQVLDVGGQFLARLVRLDRGLHGPARLVAQHHKQRDPQFEHAVREAAEHGLVEDLARGAYGHQVAEALVEDQLRRHPGVDAAEHEGEGVLTGRQRLPDGGRLVGMPLAEGAPAPVARRQLPQGLVGSGGPLARSGGDRSGGEGRGGRGRGTDGEAGAEGRGPGERGAEEGAPGGGRRAGDRGDGCRLLRTDDSVRYWGVRDHGRERMSGSPPLRSGC